MNSIEKYAVALKEKNWDIAWEIASHWWWGSPRMRAEVIFELQKNILEKLK